MLVDLQLIYSFIQRKATFSYLLIHKGSPQQLASHVWFGRFFFFFTPVALLTYAKRICVFSWDQTRSHLLAMWYVNHCIIQASHQESQTCSCLVCFDLNCWYLLSACLRETTQVIFLYDVNSVHDSSCQFLLHLNSRHIYYYPLNTRQLNVCSNHKITIEPC